MNWPQFFMDGYDLTLPQLISRYSRLTDAQKLEYKQYLGFLLTL
jgi:hypothetical protein